MRGPIGPNKSAKFRCSGSPTPRDNRDFMLLLWGNGANTGQLAYLRRHFHRKRGTETPHCTLALWPIEPNKSAKFRRSGSPTPRDNRDFRLLLCGNGAKYGPVSVPSATLSPEAVALRRHIALWACVAHRAKQVCQVSSLWGHLLREINRTSGSYYGVTGQYGPVSVPSATLSTRKRWH
ncbi:hypothetical protein DPMN_088012 [Dreissena polymorpha]|uniref:Uncharacterized protein n=1 Tax=Dreissena polymorpha TaxID=45954 RepID=A0A9D4QW53_DREPO|nr:hypothetical protein DPMN_088012 [Dreissena polymorpha]